MTTLKVITENNTTTLKNGRKVYATISYNKNPDYKFVLYLKSGIALSGYETEQQAIDRANKMHRDWQNKLIEITKKN